MTTETTLALIVGIESAILITVGLWFLDRWLISRDDTEAAMNEAVAVTQPDFEFPSAFAALAKAEADREMGRLDEVRETWST